MNTKTHLGKIQITLPIIGLISAVALLLVSALALTNGVVYSHIGAKTAFGFFSFFLLFLLFFTITLASLLRAFNKQHYCTANLLTIFLADLLMVMLLIAFATFAALKSALPQSINITLCVLTLLFYSAHTVLAAISLFFNISNK